MILVCGIHGSGKDQYSNNLKLKKDMNAYTASQLINQTLPLRQYKTKKIDQIDSRQHILLETMKEIFSVRSPLLSRGRVLKYILAAKRRKSVGASQKGYWIW